MNMSYENGGWMMTASARVAGSAAGAAARGGGGPMDEPALGRWAVFRLGMRARRVVAYELAGVCDVMHEDNHVNALCTRPPRPLCTLRVQSRPGVQQLLP